MVWGGRGEGGRMEKGGKGGEFYLVIWHTGFRVKF